MKKYRIGIIGLGMGRHHVGCFRTHPSSDVVAVADIDKNRLEEQGRELNIPGLYQDYRKMLKNEKLDIVCVATPNKFHKEMTINALRSGCHVICEKPMAMNAAESREMIKVAKTTGKRLMINFSYRFTEQGQALKKEVESGVLGDIYFARTVWHRRRGMPGFGGWFGKKAMSGGGPLIDLGVHRLDLALWLMDYPKPKWVLAGAYNHIAARIAKEQKKKFDVEDIAVAMIKFANGTTLEVEASWAANIKENEQMLTRLMGTKGGMLHKNRDEGYSFDAEIYTERNGRQFDTKLHPPVPGVHNAMYHFVECLQKNKPHLASAGEGLIVTELIDAIYKSAKTGKPVEI